MFEKKSWTIGGFGGAERSQNLQQATPRGSKNYDQVGKKWPLMPKIVLRVEKFRNLLDLGAKNAYFKIK